MTAHVGTAFGLIVTGRPIQLDFAQVAPDKFVVDVIAPATAPEIAIFMQPAAMNALPPDKGIVVYLVSPSGYTPLCVLTRSSPSSIVHTGWPTVQEMCALERVQLGLSIEDAAVVASTAVTLSTTERTDKFGFAQLVARDLFQFVLSFSQATPTGDRLQLPPDAVERWARRFEDKFKRDPNFLLKQGA